MALGINKVTLLGNVGHEPEIRSTQDGREFATFWFATTETWRDKSTGDKKENTEWHRIVAFSEGLVDIVRNYVKKGTKLYLEGSLRTRKFPDAATGQDRSSTEVILQGHGVLILLDNKRTNKPEGDFSSSQNEKSASSNHQDADIDDSVPF
jgi:single-strand DNA-binding protein